MKKHYGRWMDIIRSLELELCILTKLTKPSVPVNLVGPQVSLPARWVPASRGVFIFLCVIRRHFLACEYIAGGSELSAAVMFFHEIQRPFWWVLMTHKCRGSIVVLSIGKSVEPNEEQKEMISGFR